MKKLVSILLAVMLVISMFMLSIPSVSATQTKSSDTCILGDADTDGRITIKDSTTIQLYLVDSITLDKKQMYIADCDGSEGVTIKDATITQMYITESDTTYPTNKDGYSIGDIFVYEEPTEPTTTPTTQPTTQPPKTTKTITVGVISYVYNETSSDTSSYMIHYWNNSGFAADAVCKSLGTTESRSVGSEYWSNSAQTFRMYSVEIPLDATGFKFHIKDRWFGDDGNTSTDNAVYVFNYSGDKALYTTVNSTEPTQPSSTQPIETSPTTPAKLGLSYTFSGSNSATAGYAEGTISLTADKSGTYYLYWADDTKALDGYYEITSMSLSANSTGTFKFGYHTAIPANATKLIATASTSNTTVANAQAVYDIPVSKRLKTGSGDLKYTFNSYSDIHIDANGFYKNYEGKLKQALKFASNKNTDFIVSSGDLVNHGTDSEWETYERILSQSDYANPVYESNGNHDLRSGIDSGKKSFIRATGTDSTTVTIDANKPYYYVTEKTTGDMFIFMALEGAYDTKTVDSFTQEQISWVTNLLKTYYNTGINIYIIEHAPINGFGAGDRMSKPWYKSHLSQSFNSTQQFKALLQKYPKLIWMSGHTHIDYAMGYNYSNENGTACHMIHNSAVVGSTWAEDSYSDPDYKDGYGYNSQGYYVEVYKNQVVYYGANLTDEKIYPAYSYIMDGSRNLGTATNITPESFTGSSSTSLSTVLANAKQTLDNMYTFASYDQYQALKKIYNQYKGSTSVSNQSKVVAEIETRIEELKAIASHFGYSDPLDTYYFVNKLGWSTVYGYAWTGSSNNASWPGKALEKVGTYNGYGIYEIKFSSAGQYANLIFSNGTNQTVDIALASYSNNAFMANNTTENGKHTVTNLKYTPSGNSKYVLRYYNTGYHTWDDIDTYLTENGDGTYVYEMTTINSEDISCNVYNTIKSEYNCVSASETLNYSSGASNTYTLSASSSRGKSITIKGLSAGKKITFIYTAATKTLKITCN